LPCEVPVMTLPGAILFPGALLPLYIFEPRYRRMLADSLESHRLFAVAKQKQGRVREIPSPVAGLGMIRVAVTRPDKTSYVVLQGLLRVRVHESVRSRPYQVRRVAPLPVPMEDPDALAPLTNHLRRLVQQRLAQGLPTMPLNLPGTIDSAAAPDAAVAVSMEQFTHYLAELKDPGLVADLVSCTLLTDTEERQTVLESVDIKSRMHLVIHFLRREIERKDQSTNP